MSLLNIFEEKKEKKDIGVCIPEHRAKKLREQEMKGPHITSGTPIKNANNQTKELLVSKEGHFRVTGSYRVLDTLMLSGVVEEGIIRKRMSAEYNGKTIKVSEVRHGNEEKEQLIGGQEGTIFVSSKILPMVNTGEIIDFVG
jgi:hypothetical protein